jgi:hypothetical protein
MRRSDRQHDNPPVSRFALLPMLAEWRRDPIGWLARMSTTTAAIAAPRFGYPMRIVFDPELAGEVLGADAVLVGTSILQAPDPAEAIRALVDVGWPG